MPVTTALGDEIAGTDLSGATIACHQHVLLDAAVTLLPLALAGARVRVAAVNPDSTDDIAAAFLAANGVEVRGWSAMSAPDHRAGLDWLLTDPADAISDMGGELIAAIAELGGEPGGALEATTTGILRLTGVGIPFPVFNWNDSPLKDRLHNRHHVGLELWPAFSNVTGLAVHGRTVLVVGFGPVGRGVALRARDLGATVLVAEVDPVRALEARHHGCRDVSLADGLAAASVIVTATGRDGILGPEQLDRLRPDTIVVNVGHSNHEIDVDWLDRMPSRRMRRYVDRYDLGNRAIYLLNRGSMLNLAPGAGIAVDELFDPFAAMMLRGLAWILAGGASGAPPGLQPYPQELERDIAERTRATAR